MSEQTPQRHETPVKIVDTFLGYEDGHGAFTLTLRVEFGRNDFASVGGYNLGGDTGFAGAFIRGVLEATGSNDISQVAGKPIMLITRSNPGNGARMDVLGIKQMPYDGDGEFLFAETAARYR